MSTFSNFDPAAFLDMPIEAELTRRQPLPAGRDFLGEIKEVKAEPWRSKDKTNDDGTPKEGIRLNLQISLQIPTDIKEALGYTAETFTIRDSIMLDMTPDGGLDTAPGKNNQLRAYREALGMNKAGVPFSFRMMEGRLATFKLKHEDYQGVPQERIGAVAAAG